MFNSVKNKLINVSNGKPNQRTSLNNELNKKKSWKEQNMKSYGKRINRKYFGILYVFNWIKIHLSLNFFKGNEFTKSNGQTIKSKEFIEVKECCFRKCFSKTSLEKQRNSFDRYLFSEN
jgi:hypothetical protein